MNIEADYYFNKWIYGCFCGDELVVLDVRKGLYHSITESELQVIIPYLRDALPLPGHKSLYSGQAEDAQLHLRNMEDLGILTRSAAQGKRMMGARAVDPIDLFEHLEADSDPLFRWHHVCVMFLAGLFAHLMLKWVTFSNIIRYFQNKWRRGGGALHHERVTEIARVYNHLRPLLWRSRICLYDTLAFDFFCRLHGVKPTIVFGVIGEPFQAHCWAQVDGFILNDVPQNTKKFTPILVI